MLEGWTLSPVDPHRSLAERLARVGPPESEPAREASAIALDRVTRLCHRVLAELLFQELQVSVRGWGSSRMDWHCPHTPQFLLTHDSVFGETGRAGGDAMLELFGGKGSIGRKRWEDVAEWGGQSCQQKRAYVVLFLLRSPKVMPLYGPQPL